MSQSPIERAARALCSLAGKEPDHPAMRAGFQTSVPRALRQPGDGPFVWESYITPSRAVLQAIREPSKAMIDHGQTAIDQCLEQSEPTILADAGWSAMIDAALEEG